MANSSLIDIDGIGPVTFVRSERARHISITVKAAQTVRVAVPRRCSMRDARRFVALKKPWIMKHQARFRRAASAANQAGDAGETIDRAAAKQVLTERLAELATAHGFRYNRVYIRNQRTRWGSCSSLKNISLNINLVRLPGELIDYVLLHELVHTRIHNHSRRFWAELDKYVGNAKALAGKLRETGRALL